MDGINAPAALRHNRHRHARLTKRPGWSKAQAVESAVLAARQSGLQSSPPGLGEHRRSPCTGNMPASMFFMRLASWQSELE